MSKDQPLQKPGPMRRILGNLGFLVKGRGIAGIMLFGVTALMARTLGPAEFGFVMVIQTYVLLLRGIFEFQIYDSVVKFGVPSQDDADHPKLRRLLKLCFRVDRVARIIGTLVGLSLVPIIGPAIGMNHSQVWMMALYTLVLMITVAEGTSIGILRLFDHFDILGKQMTIGPLINFCGVLIAWWLDAPMAIFVAILAVAFISEHLYLAAKAWKIYRLHLGQPGEEEHLKEMSFMEFEGLKHFLWVTYWQSSIDLVSKHSPVIMAGYILGPAEAGLLRLAKQFSSLLAKPSILIRQVIFPDLTRSWREGSANFKLIAYKTAMMGIIIGLLFVVSSYFYGANLIETFVGKDFIAAAPVLTLMLLAATFDVSSSSLRAAAYAMGIASNVLKYYVLSFVVFLILFIFLTLHIGLIGTGMAASISAFIPLVALIILIEKNSNNTPVNTQQKK